MKSDEHPCARYNRRASSSPSSTISRAGRAALVSGGSGHLLEKGVVRQLPGMGVGGHDSCVASQFLQFEDAHQLRRSPVQQRRRSPELPDQRTSHPGACESHPARRFRQKRAASRNLVKYLLRPRDFFRMSERPSAPSCPHLRVRRAPRRPHVGSPHNARNWIRRAARLVEGVPPGEGLNAPLGRRRDRALHARILASAIPRARLEARQQLRLGASVRQDETKQGRDGVEWRPRHEYGRIRSLDEPPLRIPESGFLGEIGPKVAASGAYGHSGGEGAHTGETLLGCPLRRCKLAAWLSTTPSSKSLRTRRWRPRNVPSLTSSFESSGLEES